MFELQFQAKRVKNSIALKLLGTILTYDIVFITCLKKLKIHYSIVGSSQRVHIWINFAFFPKFWEGSGNLRWTFFDSPCIVVEWWVNILNPFLPAVI